MVQSGSDSTLGLTFIDGTVFGLGQNAKMVLNEMVYDPNGSSNSSLLSLVQGTISFVAGATAKHGNMKVDTPVATMGIRGTAVLVEIDFDVQGGSAPPARFQVLVEPDGTTGSYILFDKTTLTPIATVNQAGTQTIISGNGNVSFLSSVQLSPDAQSLINQLFAWKYTKADPNPKSDTHFTDTIIPQSFGLKLADGTIITAIPQYVFVPEKVTTSGGTGPVDRLDHIPGPPTVFTTNGASAERAFVTHSSTIDKVSGTISYADINAGDVPTASAKFDSFSYKDASNHNVTATLTAEQLAAIKAVEIPLQVEQDPARINHGTATWTYSIADNAFDFLAAGETLTLTYLARVDNNFAPNNEFTIVRITITVTGTNDAPTIATSGGTIIERIGTGNTALDTISGTVTFTDVDLTDRPIVSAALSSSQPFKYLDAQGHDITATLTQEQRDAIAAVEAQLNVVQTGGNTHNGTATWTYSVADHKFDFIADDETLILNYVVQVDDGHGGVISTPITVSINGADVSVTGTNDVPTIATTSNVFTELSDTTGSTNPDTVAGTISFTDVDLTDRPVASVDFTSFTYQNACHINVTSLLTGEQLAAIAAVEKPLTVVQAAGNTNNGSASWTYSVPDSAFDFLAEGEILTLTYTATIDDGHGGVVAKPITVTVTGTNDTPDITSGPQTATIVEIAGTHDLATPDEAHGTITFTDVDLTDTHGLTITDVSASGIVTGLANHDTQLGWLSLTASTDSTHGGTGSGSWTFSAADHYFDYLADGESVTLTYTVQVDDLHGGFASQNVAVTVNGANDAPVVDADISGANDTGLHGITERAGTTGDTADFDTASGSLAFHDVDLSDTHTVGHSGPAFSWSDPLGHSLDLTQDQLDALTAASELTLTRHDSTGTGHGSVDFNYSAADTSFDFLAAGETLTITYDITVTDENNVASTRPVTITVTGTNDAPVAVADGDIGHIVEVGNDVNDNVVPGLSTTTGDVLANDTDVDVTDTHEVVGVVAGAASGVLSSGVGTTINGTYGWLVLNANGTWTYTLDNARTATDALAQDAHASDIFSYTESDHHGGTSTTTLTIDISGTNDAPTLAVVNAGTLTDTAVNDSFPNLTGTLIGTDVDSGETGALTYAVLDTTSQTVMTVAGHYGSLTVNENGTYSYVADAAAINALHAGTYADTFTVQTTDVHGATGTATLTVNVTGANDAPVINVDNISVSEPDDEQVTVSGLSVTDIDAAANETFTITAAAADPSSSVSIASGSGSALQTVTYYEGSNEPSTDKVTLTVADGHGATDTLNLIFNLAENISQHESLVGTTGKDVFFGRDGYQDKFVFAANSSHDTIVNFMSGEDHIDLSAIVATSDVASWMADHVAASSTNPADTLVTIDAANTILLKNASVGASDFIVHP